MRSVLSTTFAPAFAFSFALAFAFTGVACAHAEAQGPHEVVPAEIVTLAPPPPPPEEPAPSPVAAKSVAERPVAPEEPALPAAWLSPPPPLTSFTEALTTAREQRSKLRAMSRGATPGSASFGTAPDAAALAWLSRAMELRERADRAYAEAWVAQDATPEGKVEVLAEATTLASDLRGMLSSAGFDEIPAAWKAEPTLHATFEDIAHGPTRRLSEESLALAQFCVTSAERYHVKGRAADSCRRAAGVPATGPEKPESKGACACAKGDPLCTTSDWCK